MNKIKHIHWIELEEDKHYLSIGDNAPWDNKICIRVPLFIAKKLNHLF